jgi:hypothetical protein
MTNAATNPTEASHLPGINRDEASLLQTASAAFLLAVARGEIDLNAFARHELASRGLGKSGEWVGFNAAEQTWSAAA